MVDLLYEMASRLLSRLEWAILVYFVLANTLGAVHLISAARFLWIHRRRSGAEQRWGRLRSQMLPRISILVPGGHEEGAISATLQAIMALDYPSFEVIAITERPPGGSPRPLQETFGLVAVHPIYRCLLPTRPVQSIYRSALHPHLLVVDKETGGRADALNAALNLATGDLVCAVDPGTLINPEGLQRLVRPFLRRPAALASGGSVLTAGGDSEHLRDSLFVRVGQNLVGGNLTLTGALGLFDRSVVVAAGGYVPEGMGEQVDMVMRLRRKARENGMPDQVEFVPDPVAWTQVSTAGAPARLHRGLTGAIIRHSSLFFNPRYGALGLVAFPRLVLFEWLAPLMELAGLVGLVIGLALGSFSLPFAALYWAVVYGYSTLLLLFAVVLEDIYQPRFRTTADRLKAMLRATVQNLGLRQHAVLWRVAWPWRER